jgi:hypothetical protein
MIADRYSDDKTQPLPEDEDTHARSALTLLQSLDRFVLALYKKELLNTETYSRVEFGIRSAVDYVHNTINSRQQTSSGHTAFKSDPFDESKK